MTDDKYKKIPVKQRARVKAAAKHMQRFLETMGADMSDPNLQDTPFRVSKMFACELLSGETDDGPEMVSFLTPGVHNEFVVEKNLPVRSLCSHHLLPISGMAHIGAYYQANGEFGVKLPGLSKYGRVVDHFSRRFQLQERLGAQVANYIMDHTEARLVVVRIVAAHHCMIHRGIQTENSMTTTECILLRNGEIWPGVSGALYTPEWLINQFNSQLQG